MSEPREPRPVRPAEARADDHAAIDRLAGELLPALVAKLTATGLGEIEVREDDWKVRVRRPPGGTVQRHGRRASDRASRPQPGHEGHGHAPGAVEAHRSARIGQTSHSSNGSSPIPSPRPVAEHDAPERRAPADPSRAIATSPAVGVFRPRPDARPGTRVRAGDRLGVVDMLGIPQDVVAPADGIVAQVLVESGDAVEYGQELVELDLLTQAPAAGAGSPTEGAEGA